VCARVPVMSKEENNARAVENKTARTQNAWTTTCISQKQGTVKLTQLTVGTGKQIKAHATQLLALQLVQGTRHTAAGSTAGTRHTPHSCWLYSWYKVHTTQLLALQLVLKNWTFPDLSAFRECLKKHSLIRSITVAHLGEGLNRKQQTRFSL
jgi:hypothetical protein